MKVSRNGAIALSWNDPIVIVPLAFVAPVLAALVLVLLLELPQAAMKFAPRIPAAPSAPRSIAFLRVMRLSCVMHSLL
jgi:hypothetical protein